MAVQNGNGPESLFSEGTTGRTGKEQPEISGGCVYHTPAGLCGDSGEAHTIDGFRLELCGEHLEAVLVENGLEVPA